MDSKEHTLHLIKLHTLNSLHKNLIVSYIARMTAIEDLTTGKVKVLYVSTHTSHEPCPQEVESLNFAESSITVGRYI